MSYVLQKPLLVLFVLAVGFAATACQGSGDASEGDKTGIRSDGFPAPGRQAVWDAAARVLREHQMVPDSDASSPEGGIVVSRWHVSLSPFSREGWREKATVRILQVPDRPGYWRTETNVSRQMNTNVSDPSNPLAAEWADGQRRPDVESLLNKRIELYFLPNDVSPVFRRHHGMPDAESPRLEGLPQAPVEDEDPFGWLVR